MKHLKPYELFETSIQLTESQILWLDRCTRGTWTLNSDNKIDVEGDFYCHRQELRDFKGVEFGEISGHFNCLGNHLTSLEGGPQKVGKSFSCQENELVTLKGAPEEVGGGFNCDYNQLTSLEGAPRKVGGSFLCNYNQLTSLEGAPRSFGDFSFIYNPVSKVTLSSILAEMRRGLSYQNVLKELWTRIPLLDQILLYRPHFEWVDIDHLYKQILESPNSKGLLSRIRRDLPELWGKLSSVDSESGTSADLGDLGF